MTAIRSTLVQLVIELKMYIRQPLYLLFSIVMPLMSFLIFGSMYSNMTYGGIDFFTVYIPSFLMLILFSSSVFSVGNQLISDKEKGIYKRIRATPISLVRFISVILIKATIIAMLGFMLIMISASVCFHIPLGVKKIPFFFVYVLFTLFALMLGIIIALLVKKVNTYTMVMMTLFFPMFFLSDATVPLTMMPKWMQEAALFNPLYHANRILRYFWNYKFHILYRNNIWESFMFLFIIFMALFCLLLVRWKEAYDEF
ncbi:MAG: ABC transporter permease [Lentilactobacillus diolivorans]|uniref:Transport permease protein n=3 Tax=Lentilactobacillus diolivorans TaxID=179838 RepID=A0A0R1S994_9LACO|nr:ABC transporter permease [Lentilactobacillus diolivorans]KRL64969.1 multidrug abc transporter, permease [Lentilactobacillus diolivorans DSM 14421]MCH4165421.1 ABC transporter permease [Lentilactobacillus diolivorans]RRG01221.1 MAG: ABC transporter permease [Lactobacillus sp.]